MTQPWYICDTPCSSYFSLKSLYIYGDKARK